MSKLILPDYLAKKEEKAKPDADDLKVGLTI